MARRAGTAGLGEVGDRGGLLDWWGVGDEGVARHADGSRGAGRLAGAVCCGDPRSGDPGEDSGEDRYEVGAARGSGRISMPGFSLVVGVR